MNNELADKIKYHRKISSKTQEDMAQLLRVKRSTYGEYERGTNLPPVDKLIIMAKCFNVSIDYLVGNSDKETVDIKETIEYLLKELNYNEVLYDMAKVPPKMSNLIACSLEHILNLVTIYEKDELN